MFEEKNKHSACCHHWIDDQ